MKEQEPVRFRYLVLWSRDGLPLLAEAWRCQLLERFAHWARRLGALPVALGGSENRIWAILGTSPDSDGTVVADELRSRACAWITRQSGIDGFVWEDAYAWIPLTPEELSLLVDVAEEGTGLDDPPFPDADWRLLEEPADGRSAAAIR